MKTETFLFKKDHSFDKCTSCNAVGKLRSSRPKNSLERNSIFVFWGFYRCRECGWRGRKFSFTYRRISFKSIILYLFLMLATAVIVNYVVQIIAMN